MLFTNLNDNSPLLRLYFSVGLLLACGKYSPALSPDIKKPSPPVIEEIASFDKYKVKFTIRHPIKRLDGTLMEDYSNGECLYTNLLNDLIYEKANCFVKNQNLTCECQMPQDFVGHLKVFFIENDISGLPSQNSIRIFNKEKLDVYLE
ncbi:MAG: hypothetical protein NZO16_05825 [Deltaproteobacteria bacterium]|nr:hypothetical protein [Deltaproteobacteria bacterium]